MKIINKLKNSIENGNLVIIKNLEKLYPSLYYLFNQSYEIKGDNKYIKISYGSSYSKYYKLNEKFRVVILLNEKELKENDPPFLSRFEKYLIDINMFLNQDLLKLSDEIIHNFYELFEIEKTEENKIYLSLFLNFIKEEEIKCLIYKLKNFEGKKDGEIKNEILKKISNLVPIGLIEKFIKKNRNNNNLNDSLIHFKNSSFI